MNIISPVSYCYIDTPDALSECVQKLAQHALCMLDTEFIKTDTFYPKLGLLQINVAGQNYIIDGLNLELADFWHVLLTTPQRLLVMHACSEDIELICHYAKTRVLPPIFDTQVGLSFLGYGLQISYQKALNEVLGVVVDKGETLSDWLARPLRPQQLAYAANDVEYLPALYQSIVAQLQVRNRLDAAQQDCAQLLTELTSPTNTDLLYRTIGCFMHTRLQLMQIQQLAVWREHIAVSLNIPRGFIFKNAVLLSLVENPPVNMYALHSVDGLRSSTVKAYGKIILDLLAHVPPSHSWPQRLPKPYKNNIQPLSSQLKAVIDTASQQVQVEPAVLLRKKWLNELIHIVAFDNASAAAIASLSPYLMGWRYALITHPLIELLVPYAPQLQHDMQPFTDRYEAS